MSFQKFHFRQPVQHAGGATDILVNQQQPSAGWFRLASLQCHLGQNYLREEENFLKRTIVNMGEY
jgi:hypothetical protein